MKRDEADFRKLIQAHVRDTRGRERAQLIRDADHETFNTQKKNFDQISFLKDTSKAQTIMGRHPRPLRFYTALGDPALSVYINDAKEKARGNYNIGMRHWFKEYVLGVAFISIKLFGRLVLIRIMPADSFEFEFATSGNPITTYTATQEGMSFNSYRGIHVGVHVGMLQGVMVTDPVIRTQKRSVNGSGSDTSVNARAYQIELINEPVAYTTPQDVVNRKRFPYELYESYAPGNPHTGVYTRCNGWGMNAGWLAWRSPTFQHFVRDEGFDVPYEDSQNVDPVRLAYIRDNSDADWPRANGKQIVTDATYGTREFAIYVDAYNQFYVFPTAAIEPLSVVNPYLQNVPGVHVTKLTPTIPAWCYKQSGRASDLTQQQRDDGDWITDLPEPDWKFDHEGKRAASIFYERVAYSRDDSLFDSADGTGAPDPFTSAEFDTMVADLGIAGRHGTTFNLGHNEQRYFVAPGIIEVLIDIQLTGDDLNEYLATIQTREVRKPSTDEVTPDEYCSMYVGYVWHDVPFGAKVVKDKLGNIVKDDRIAKAGDFVTYDVDWYYRITDAAEVPTRMIHTIRRIDVGGGGAVTYTELMNPADAPVVAIDLTTLSFVHLITDPEYTKRVCPEKTGDPYSGTYNVDWITPHFGMSIVAGAKYRETLFPEKMPTLRKTEIINRVTAFYATPLGGRAAITELMQQPGWVRMPLNDKTDWSTGNYNAWRLYQLTQMDHLQGPHSNPADGPAISKYCLQATYAYLPPIHCYFSASFKFAWYTYADLIQNHHHASPDTTFFVHPTGSYAFWCNTYTYPTDGVPYVGDYVNTLDAFDPKKTMEHCIFDRVHFELRTNNILLGRHDTTFLELYNRAVIAGQKAKTLADDIVTIAPADLRGTFEKEIITYPDAPYTDVTYLDLKLTWNGTDYWYPETGIQGGGWHSTLPWPRQGGIVGLTFNHPWFTAANYGGYAMYPSLGTKHIRFANAIILQTKL